MFSICFISHELWNNFLPLWQILLYKFLPVHTAALAYFAAKNSSRTSQWKKKAADIISYVSKVSPPLCLFFSQVCQALPCLSELNCACNRQRSIRWNITEISHLSTWESQNEILMRNSTWSSFLHMKPKMNGGFLDLKIPFQRPALVHGHGEVVWLVLAIQLL